jgi:hypothetical protein
VCVYVGVCVSLDAVDLLYFISGVVVVVKSMAYDNGSSLYGGRTHSKTSILGC